MLPHINVVVDAAVQVVRELIGALYAQTQLYTGVHWCRRGTFKEPWLHNAHRCASAQVVRDGLELEEEDAVHT